ncbi:MAG: hypothetical protein PUG74_08785 [Prevotellaceae bacterium]|nr:hypothetical protein [Prevotellaceae bacterium]
MKQQSVFIKYYGAEAADDRLVRIGKDSYALFYGFGNDEAMEGSGYQWRKDYDHLPTVEEVKADIEELINAQTEHRITYGLIFGGGYVYLSRENQLNFNNTVSVPVTYKLGEFADGHPMYYTFGKQADLTTFRRAVGDHISQCLTEGYEAKDAVDYDKIMGGVE